MNNSTTESLFIIIFQALGLEKDFSTFNQIKKDKKILPIRRKHRVQQEYIPHFKLSFERFKWT